ncbi:MAG TPA: hypothetical protein VM598_08150 [Bdellovibrionota bacterium]|nr:hypothetical protein [Bdellovibrionota bacterium]
MKTRTPSQVLVGTLAFFVFASSPALAEDGILGDPVSVTIGPSAYLKDDGRGAYTHGVDYVRAVVSDEWFGVGPYYPSKGTPDPIRFLYWNFNFPVPGSGAAALGIAGSDPRGNHIHVCASDGSSVANLPPGTTVQNASSDAHIRVNGTTHVLIFGNGCHSQLNGAGTGTFTITRNLDGTWDFSLPEGSIGALYRGKGKGWIRVGSYYFGAQIHAEGL